MKTALTIEAHCYSLCYGTEDKTEGTIAFMEKRQPIFKGR
jgi:enoyl-CoA hydratase